MKPPSDVRAYLVTLRAKRRQGKRNSVRERRVSLTAAERRQVLAKTSGRCHICGGKDHLHLVALQHRVVILAEAGSMGTGDGWLYVVAVEPVLGERA